MGGVCSSLGICESTDDQQTVQQTNKNDGKVDDKVDDEVDDKVDDNVADDVADNQVDDDDVYVWLILAFDLRMHSVFDFLTSLSIYYTFILII